LNSFVLTKVDLMKFWICLQVFMGCHDDLYSYMLALK
jgi:hypothetical protein